MGDHTNSPMLVEITVALFGQLAPVPRLIYPSIMANAILLIRRIWTTCALLLVVMLYFVTNDADANVETDASGSVYIALTIAGIWFIGWVALWKIQPRVKRRKPAQPSVMRTKRGQYPW